VNYLKIQHAGFFVILVAIGITANVTGYYVFAEEVTVYISKDSSVQICDENDECLISSQISINLGDTVTWVNEDTVAHSIASSSANEDENVFDSLVVSGSSFSHTFTEYGIYQYFSSDQPLIQGEVVVGGLTNPNLFVSAENPQFANHMVGPQVIEIVVIDPDIDDTDEGKGEPDVSVNSKKIRMVQAVDGNWYGYFSDRKQAEIADNTNIDNALFPPGFSIAGSGLDFGLFCDSQTTMDGVGGAQTGPVTFSETVGIAINAHSGAVTSGTNSTVPPLGTCGLLPVGGGAGSTTVNDGNNMVREAKSVNINVLVAPGQIDIDPTYYPVIQLYDLNPTGSVIIKYNKGGGAQSVTLTFDTVDHFAGLELDRTKYTIRSQVHATITDIQLNMDPTDEDSWTFATNATGDLQTFYQLFDENGLQTNGTAAAAIIVDQPGGATDLNRGATLPNLQFEDNGILILDVNVQGAVTDIVNLQNNDNQDIVDGPTAADAVTTGGALAANSQPITIVERFVSNGIFANYDFSDMANIITTKEISNTGKSATIDYNGIPQSILIGFEDATVDIQPVDAKWNSGEKIPFVLVDADANKNSRIDEDLDVFDPNVALIPALATGSPFTLSDGDTNRFGFFTGAVPTAVGAVLTSTGIVNATTDVQEFSFRGIVEIDDPVSNSTWTMTNGDGIVIDYRPATFGTLGNTVVDTRTKPAPSPGGHDAHAFNYYNYDLRSIYANATATFISLDVYLLNGTSIIDADGSLGDPKIIAKLTPTPQTTLQGLFSINATYPYATVFDDPVVQASTPGVFINFTSTGAGTVFDSSTKPIISDFFSFGFLLSGLLSQERFANQVIRIEAEETGDNTDNFTGSLEFIMVNQLNILDQATYDNLSPIKDNPTFIAIQNLTGQNAPKASYLDVGKFGISNTVSDKEDALTHTGAVTLSSTGFQPGDLVEVTLNDLDLNTNGNLIDIYTAVLPTAGENASDTIGKAGLRNLPDGTAFGRLLEITFNDDRWLKSTVPDSDGITCAQIGGTDGLEASNFVLVETNSTSGEFVGGFILPTEYCSRSTGGDIKQVEDAQLKAKYLDFRNTTGGIIEIVEPDTGGTLKITKNAIGGDAIFNFTVTNSTFTLPLSINTNVTSMTSSVTIDPGFYNVTENVPSGWNNTASNCEKNSISLNTTLNLNITAGDFVECIFENTFPVNGTLKITKNAIGGDAIFNFTVTNSTLTIPLSISTNVTNMTAPITIDPGFYNVTEIVPASWNNTASNCEKNSISLNTTLNLNITAGDFVECIFENTFNLGTLKITKNAIGGDAIFNFTVTNSTFTLPLSINTNVTSMTLPVTLDPGFYNVTEIVPSGWNLTASDCEKNSISLGTTLNINITAGDSVECIFEDTKIGLPPPPDGFVCGPGTIPQGNECLPDFAQICGAGTILQGSECIVDPTLTVISENTVLLASTTVLGDVLIQSNALFTIPAGVTLTVPEGHKILIKTGAGLLVEEGGTVIIGSGYTVILEQGSGLWVKSGGNLIVTV